MRVAKLFAFCDSWASKMVDVSEHFFKMLFSKFWHSKSRLYLKMHKNIIPYPVLYKNIAGTIGTSPPILNHVVTWMAGWKPNGDSRNIVQKIKPNGVTTAWKVGTQSNQYYVRWHLLRPQSEYLESHSGPLVYFVYMYGRDMNLNSKEYNSSRPLARLIPSPVK